MLPATLPELLAERFRPGPRCAKCCRLRLPHEDDDLFVTEKAAGLLTVSSPDKQYQAADIRMKVTVMHTPIVILLFALPFSIGAYDARSRTLDVAYAYEEGGGSEDPELCEMPPRPFPSRACLQQTLGSGTALAGNPRPLGLPASTMTPVATSYERKAHE